MTKFAVFVFASYFAIGCALDSISFYVPPNMEVCVSEEIAQHAKVEVFFEVISGGNFDLNFRIVSPDSEQHLGMQSRKEEHLKFYAMNSGAHRFCFENPSEVSKRVNLDIDVGGEGDKDALIWKKLPKYNEKGMWDSVRNIYKSLQVIQGLQRSFSSQASRHRSTLESASVRIQRRSVLTCFVLFVVAALQILYVRRTFSRRHTSKV